MAPYSIVSYFSNESTVRTDPRIPVAPFLLFFLIGMEPLPLLLGLSLGLFKRAHGSLG